MSTVENRDKLDVTTQLQYQQQQAAESQPVALPKYRTAMLPQLQSSAEVPLLKHVGSDCSAGVPVPCPSLSTLSTLKLRV